VGGGHTAFAREFGQLLLRPDQYSEPWKGEAEQFAFTTPESVGLVEDYIEQHQYADCATTEEGRSNSSAARALKILDGLSTARALDVATRLVKSKRVTCILKATAARILRREKGDGAADLLLESFSAGGSGWFVRDELLGLLKPGDARLRVVLGGLYERRAKIVGDAKGLDAMDSEIRHVERLLEFESSSERCARMHGNLELFLDKLEGLKRGEEDEERSPGKMAEVLQYVSCAAGKPAAAERLKDYISASCRGSCNDMRERNQQMCISAWRVNTALDALVFVDSLAGKDLAVSLLRDPQVMHEVREEAGIVLARAKAYEPIVSVLEENPGQWHVVAPALDMMSLNYEPGLARVAAILAGIQEPNAERRVWLSRLREQVDAMKDWGHHGSH